MVQRISIAETTISKPTTAFAICSFAPLIANTLSVVMYLNPPIAIIITASSAAVATAIVSRLLRRLFMSPKSRPIIGRLGESGTYWANAITGAANSSAGSTSRCLICFFIPLCVLCQKTALGHLYSCVCKSHDLHTVILGLSLCSRLRHVQ